MENHFIPYELAVKLKELGFKFYPLGYYSLLEGNKIIESKFYASDDFLEAPLWQQAFDWFREKYNLDSYVRRVTYKEWKFEINFILQNDSKEEWEKYKKFQDYKDTQKEAREACLEKLIKLCKNK